MSKSAIRLLTLVICVTALVAVPMVTSAEAETSSSRHIQKHKKKISTPRSAGQARPVSRPSSEAGAACSRGFDCAMWPPPMSEDFQRNSSGDGM